MLAEPISKKLIRNTYLRTSIFDSLQADGHKPGVVNLFWNPSLNIGQGFLPDCRNCHNS
jgi:hypothetical protein